MVSDVFGSTHGVVVVRDRDGRHRFTYTGHPDGTAFLPLGICTDAFSNILVCDAKSSFVHVIKEDGHLCVVVSHKSGPAATKHS